MLLTGLNPQQLGVEDGGLFLRVLGKPVSTAGLEEAVADGLAVRG